ncbi:hypothetical protein C9890_0347 [Perkinsus sp. BL_2016]|nr:hypothetical protein C9890_0347 [Perkinsus sp. BL_2016]
MMIHPENTGVTDSTMSSLSQALSGPPEADHDSMKSRNSIPVDRELSLRSFLFNLNDLRTWRCNYSQNKAD